jgi:hypothetical protein
MKGRPEGEKGEYKGGREKGEERERKGDEEVEE